LYQPLFSNKFSYKFSSVFSIPALLISALLLGGSLKRYNSREAELYKGGDEAAVGVFSISSA